MSERRAAPRPGAPSGAADGAGAHSGDPRLPEPPPPLSALSFGRPPDLVWRVAAVAVAATLLWPLVGWVVRTVTGPGYSLAGHALSAALVSLVAIPMVVLARRHLDRRPWSGLGLTPLREGWRHLLLGMAVWSVPAAVGTAVCVAFGWTRITLLTSVPEALLFIVVLAVLVLFYEALPEELVFRGYLQRNLMTAMRPGAAVLAQAVLFSLFGAVLWGVLGDEPIGLARFLVLLAVGIVLGCIRVVSGNTWACVGFHLSFQVAAQVLLATDAHGQFAVGDPLPLLLIAFAFLPCGLAVLLYQLAHPAPVNWRTPEPDREP
ncbi:hypothetical protein HNR23_003864 [Nocardiopsis mwathae]|uniref:CAAX prenyl protease 2/Lysostaphin resistance protein A-like domain-containing protein n=1 Tax=Nocardiopsis mwathae TaxID=1472723 RepID=A0A7W9YKQ0_9ACTN|nr:CPBP family intramembrane glutamic endopeptidase [Nocardiopsis mwathae]MBB6173804.1 hypothetical protein [Nocardiopsis mwathae]